MYFFTLHILTKPTFWLWTIVVDSLLEILRNNAEIQRLTKCADEQNVKKRLKDGCFLLQRATVYVLVLSVSLYMSTLVKMCLSAAPFRPLRTSTSSSGGWLRWCWSSLIRFSPTSSSWRWFWSGWPTASRSTSPTTGAGWTSSLSMWVLVLAFAAIHFGFCQSVCTPIIKLCAS